MSEYKKEPMKKLFSGIVVLGLLASFLVPQSSQAGIIAVGTISADATASGLNQNFITIVDAVNGQIQGSATTGSTTNILADSIGELDMGDEVNPRVRDGELLGIGVDSTTTQSSFVYTGLIPATSANLTSNISAGTAYINGYRVVKTATSKTYTASMDTYVDLSQTGVYTFSEVSVGGTAPSVASNSSRLARVTTSGTAITTVTDLANRRIPGLIIPSNYRNGLFISKDSATTVKVFPGSAEINNAMINKTSTTTLTISTAGDWAGGSALNAADTFGYIGMDASGNLKLHTTAPAYNNYGVSTTEGRKRYSTASSTVYRTLGWLYMSGASVIDNASNIKEGDVSNIVMSNDGGIVANAATTFAEVSKINFYSSGGKIRLSGIVSGDSASGTAEVTSIFRFNSTNIPASGASSNIDPAGESTTTSIMYLDTNRSQGTMTYSIMNKVASNNISMRNRTLIVEEE